MADANGYNLNRVDDGADVADRDPATELEAARIDALTFFSRGDYRGARIRANAALLIISTIPNGMIQGMASQTWDRPGIVLFLEQLDKLESSEATSESGGMVLQSYSYSGRRSC
jgi:hypothetical protein